jgi:hypothetical protein
MAATSRNAYREAFVSVLLGKFPSWRDYVAERAQDGPLRLR